MSHLFLTGGTGFIGYHLTRQLLNLGYEVTLLTHRSHYTGGDHSRLHLIQGDLRNPKGWSSVLAGIDGVIHLAGSVSETSLYRYIKANTEATQRLAEACSKHRNIHQFIFISSLAAAGPSEPGNPLSEYQPPNPVSAYGKSKLMAESRLLFCPSEYQKTILRPPPVYGPGDRGLYPVFRLAHHRIKPFLSKGIQELSIIHVFDLCEIITRLILNPRLVHDEIFYVNDGIPIHTLEKLFTILENLTGKKSIQIPFHKALMGGVAYLSELAGIFSGKSPLYNMSKYRELKQRAWTCNSEKIMQFLEYTVQNPLEIGLRDTYTWYRAHGWL
jgi:nucleoside-diphosphate-sugar epimerase